MRPARSLVRCALAGALLLGVATGPVADARADALLVAGPDRRFPTTIDVDVDVRAQVESTTYRFGFAPLTRPGTYTLTVPAPPGGSPIGVDVDRGDGFVEVPVVTGPPGAAAGGTGDPAVVAWHGTSPLVADLEDLAPGPLTVRVRFVRLLRRAGGEVAFEVGARRCPARDAYDPGARVRVQVRVATARDLSLFAANGGTGTAIAQGLRVATAATAAADLWADEVLRVRYREVSSGIHAQLVTHRLPDADPLGGTDGYFLLLLDADELGSGVPRTVNLVLDRSGSMAGAKIAQARAAGQLMLEHLTADDRFALHAFDSVVTSFRAAPVAATAGNLAAARAWLAPIVASGGTNLDAGVRAGLAAPAEDGRFDALVLLSDGLASVGQQDPRQILASARQLAAGHTRIFTVSVGVDADLALMEALARHNRGRHLELNDAQAALELADRIRELFEDLHDVRLTDVALAVTGVDVRDQLPEAPPDLFAGGQVVIVGRYRQPGVAEVRLTGREGAQPFERVLRFDAPAQIETDDVIRQVWAGEQVRALMATLAEGADPAAVRARVEELGVAYRIQTPYTRFAGAVDEPQVTTGGAGCSAAAGGSLWLALALLGLNRRSGSSRSRSRPRWTRSSRSPADR